MSQAKRHPAPAVPGVAKVLDPSVRAPGIGRVAFRVIVFGLLQKLINMVVIFTATQNGLNHESATSSDLQAFGVVLFVLFAAVICPVVETIALQALPLEVMRNKGVPRPLAILASALLFGLWHAREGAAKVAGTFAVGLMLAWIYERYRDENTIPWVLAVTAIEAASPGFWTGMKLGLQGLFSRFSPTGFMYVALPHVVSNTIALVALIAISISKN
ncbi:CPBP family intramembrane glutamic endopeptidase [Massilia sp. H6]|uniref:CPBP family intramembrane glutamic endopeptidase n=1 Tax=Massilia sp. H6 TaxID=2970464 RepID=UPI0021670728|nr:CPBP family intramembrane glutamic endopeptidase [Massilia sp. H6]UVW30565.1 CPBP family intramembrane metalloprotease [Massilia sp. H6]